MASFVLSFFPLDVLDEIWDSSQFLRDFLPTLASVLEMKRRYVSTCGFWPEL